MQIEKQKAVDMVRRVAGPQRAEEAERLLPDPIDLDRYAGTLRELGLDPEALVAPARTWVPGPLRSLLSRFAPGAAGDAGGSSARPGAPGGTSAEG
jgi:hypothetical protein